MRLILVRYVHRQSLPRSTAESIPQAPVIGKPLRLGRFLEGDRQSVAALGRRCHAVPTEYHSSVGCVRCHAVPTEYHSSVGCVHRVMPKVQRERVTAGTWTAS